MAISKMTGCGLIVGTGAGLGILTAVQHSTFSIIMNGRVRSIIPLKNFIKAGVVFSLAFLISMQVVYEIYDRFIREPKKFENAYTLLTRTFVSLTLAGLVTTGVAKGLGWAVTTPMALRMTGVVVTGAAAVAFVAYGILVALVPPCCCDDDL